MNFFKSSDINPSSPPRAIFMQGPSGAGKSGLASKIALGLRRHDRGCCILSADRLLEAFGGYLWSPDGCYLAHRLKLEMLKTLLASGFKGTVILDDTNLKAKDIRAAAELFGPYDPAAIVPVSVPPSVTAQDLFRRNLHGVPLETIEKQLALFRAFDYKQFGIEEAE